MSLISRFACALVLSGCFVGVPEAYSQVYPRKPITLIVPNGVGGAFDAAARPLALALGQALGQPFIVDNRPAGSGVAGALAVAKAAPDGYTILFSGNGNITLFPALRQDLPYDPVREYSPIVRIGTLESFIMVNPSVPVNSLRELFELAKAKPDSITWGNWGSTSPSNMYVQWLKKARNIQFYAVPYRTAAQALNAGVAGEVQVTLFGQGQATPMVKAGKFRALAATGSRRSLFLPQVPTLRETETGFDLDTTVWIGMFAPIGTPKEIVNKLNSAVRVLLADPSYTEKALVSLGYQPDEPASPEEFSEYLKRDRKTYEDLIKLTGIKDE